MIRKTKRRFLPKKMWAVIDTKTDTYLNCAFSKHKDALDKCNRLDHNAKTKEETNNE